MTRSDPQPPRHFEVSDAAAAFQKFEDFTRRVLAVPKKEIGKSLAKEKSTKKKLRRR